MIRLLVVLIFVALTACSEGSRNSTQMPDNTENPDNDNDPDAGSENPEPGEADIGSYTLVNAYPNLSFSRAVFAAGVPGGNRLAVVEQRGRIVVFENDQSAAGSREVLDISGAIESGGEQGLLGLAFDPAFEDNGYVYMHYTMNPPRRSVISRMTWSFTDDVIDPTSELILMEVNQPYRNHNAGMLAFGPDGYLYIAMGDGGSGGDPDHNGQDKTTLLGSLLRIDVSAASPASPYTVPVDNPFLDDSAARAEIYALGLRNPYRFSFDRDTGELWLGDVGQGAWEEINIIESGGNYGWRYYEGDAVYNDSGNTQDSSAFESPILAYGRGDGYSVTGGYVYRGSLLNRLSGYYLYADYGSGTVWALKRQGDDVSNLEIATAANPTSFGETNDGEVLVVTHDSGLFRLIETDR